MVNDGIFWDLELEMTEWSQANGQIRCLAHVLNLAVQIVVKTFRSEVQEREVDSASDDQGDLPNNNEVDPGITLHKLPQILAKIRSSNIMWESLQDDVQRKWLSWLVPLLNIHVRLNSTHHIIPRASYLRPALERLLAIGNSHKFSKARIPMTLSLSDWKILERLEKILYLVFDATEFATADDAYKKLNQYWVKTDANTGQVIATILDPPMKLQLL
ncbi:hypothetical protein HOY80DRAFT_1049993 [Tuber brumale]|nr:hypothetical protein HOY80DRAFT_1049993 [Tuber brumale]